MSNRFKSALFSGFNRRDVVSYITDQAKQKEALSDQAAELSSQLEELREALAAAREENQALQAELAEARQRADRAERTCRDLQQAVRSSLTELNVLSGAFGCDEEETPAEAPEAVLPPEGPGIPEDDGPDTDPGDIGLPDTGDSPEPADNGPEFPGDDTPADVPSEEPAAPAAEDAPVKRRTVEIRRHERI